jgi:NYN domain
MVSLKEILSSKKSIQPKYKVITYIDGFNLYFGIRYEAIKRGTLELPDPRWYRYMWLDLVALSNHMLNPFQYLVATKYFTAPIIANVGNDKQLRQNTYLDALRTLPNLEIILGRFEPNRNECDHCQHVAYHPQEKKTDVNIATTLIIDALDDKFDTAIIVTGDSDIAPALEVVKKKKPEKRLVAAFPPNRYSKELEDLAHVKPPIRIWEPMLKKSRLPDIIKREGLPDVVCPDKYNG